MSFRKVLPFSSDDEEIKTVEKPKSRPATSGTGSYARPRGSYRKQALARVEKADNEDEIDELDDDSAGLVGEEEGGGGEDSDQGDMFQAVRIIKQRRNKFLVEWAGIDPKTNKPWEPTWEPYDHCNVLLMEEWELLKASKAEEEKKKKDAHEGKLTKDKRKRESTSSSTSTVPPKRTRTSLPTAGTSRLSPPSKPTSYSSSIEDFFGQAPSKPSQRSNSKSSSDIVSSKSASSSALASTPKTTRPAQSSSARQSSKKKMKPSLVDNTQIVDQNMEDEVIVIDELDPSKETSRPADSELSTTKPAVDLPTSKATSSEDLVRASIKAIDPLQAGTSKTNSPPVNDKPSHITASNLPPLSPSPQMKPSADKHASPYPTTTLPLISQLITDSSVGNSAKGATVVPQNVPSFPFSVAAPKANSLFASVTQKANQESLQGNSSKGTIIPDSQTTSSVRSQPLTGGTAPHSHLFASVSNSSSSLPTPTPALDATAVAPLTATSDSTSTSDVTLIAAHVSGQSKEQEREPMSSQIEEFTPPNQQESSQPTPSPAKPVSEKASKVNRSESISHSSSSTNPLPISPSQPILNSESAAERPSRSSGSQQSDTPRPILPIPQSKVSSHHPPPTFRSQASTSVINKTVSIENNSSVPTSISAAAALPSVSFIQTSSASQKNLTDTATTESQRPVDESVVKDSQLSGPPVNEEDQLSVISIEDADESDTIEVASSEKPETEPKASSSTSLAAVPPSELTAQIRTLKSELSAANKSNEALEEQNTVLQNRLKSTEDDNEFIKDQYRTSSDRAVSAARELQQAESTIAKLESQVKLGVQQMNLMFQSQVNTLTRQVTQLRAQKELLLEQAARTDGEVRERAARAPVLEREVELLKAELEETRLAAEEAEDSVEALQLEVRRLRALNRRISSDDAPSEADSEGNMAYLPVDEADDDSYKGGSPLPDRSPQISTRRTAAAAAAAAAAANTAGSNNGLQSADYPVTTNGTVQTLTDHLHSTGRTIPASPLSPASSVLDLTMTTTANDPSGEFDRPPSESLPPSPGLEFISPAAINPLFLQQSHPHHRRPTRSISPMVNARDETESLEPEFLGGLPPVIPVEMDDDGGDSVGGSTVGRVEIDRELRAEDALPDKVFQCQWQTVDGESCDMLAPSRESLIVHMMAHGIHLSI